MESTRCDMKTDILEGSTSQATAADGNKHDS